MAIRREQCVWRKYGGCYQFLFIRVKGLPSVRLQIFIDTSRLGYNPDQTTNKRFLNTKKYNQDMVHFAILLEQLLDFGKHFLIIS